MIDDYFNIALKNLKNRALRSWLTVLGVVLGVFLITSLLTFSEAIPRAVQEMLRQIGGDVIMVMPGEGIDISTYIGFASGLELGNEELEAVKRARGVDIVLEMPFQAENVRWRDQVETVLVWGLDFESGLEMIRDDMGWRISEGRYPRPGRREVILGQLIPRNFFPGIQPGDEITVSGRKFTVSGIMQSLGHRENDSTILFDIDDYRSVTGTREGTPVIMARVEQGHDLNVVISNIERSLEDTIARRRGEDSPSFTVLSSDAMLELVDTVLGAIQSVIIALSLVSVLVGSIGIMNTTFTSVNQREKEIGVLKAVGAKKRDILAMFLIESGIIGLVGGLIGIASGISFAYFMAYLVNQNPEMIVEVQVQASPYLAIFAVLGSLFLGVVSGYLPAKKAADLNPVDALMYE